MKREKTSLFFIIAAAVCIALLAGCSGPGKSDEPPAVTFRNSTGKDITEIAVKGPDEENYSGNRLTDDESLKDGDEWKFVYGTNEKQESGSSDDGGEDGESGENGGETVNSAGDEDTDVIYDIQLTFDDGSKLILNDVTVSDMEEAEILIEDKVAFIKYISLETKEAADTKDYELKLMKEAEEKAAREAAEKAAAEKAAKEAAEKAAAEQAAREAAAAQAARNSQKSSGGGSGNAGGQNTEGCIPDDPSFFN